MVRAWCSLGKLFLENVSINEKAFKLSLGNLGWQSVYLKLASHLFKKKVIIFWRNISIENNYLKRFFSETPVCWLVIWRMAHLKNNDQLYIYLQIFHLILIIQTRWSWQRQNLQAEDGISTKKHRGKVNKKNTAYMERKKAI